MVYSVIRLFGLFVGFSSGKEWCAWMSYLGSQISYCVEDLDLKQAEPKYIGVDCHQYIQGIDHKI